MPPRLPQQSDFPSSLTLSITAPPSTSTSTSTRTPQNCLILLHGLGDTLEPFTSLARALKLPETVIIAIQAPQPLPFGLGPGWHWSDDLTFSSSEEAVEADSGFNGARKVIGDVVIRDGLIEKCGFAWQRVFIYGFGQGGMVGLAVAASLSSISTTTTGKEGPRELGGVISVGGGLPSDVKATEKEKGKSRTPVLVMGGLSRSAITTSAVRRMKDAFEFVTVHQFKRPGDAMPSNREEMLPVMQFLAQRLRSRAGVPDGAVELS